MIFRKGLILLEALSFAFFAVGCSDDDDESQPETRRDPFTVLSEVSIQGIASCKINYNAGDTMVAAQLKSGKDVVDLTFSEDPCQVLEKASIDMDDYVRNYQDVEVKKGKVLSMISANGATSDSILYAYENGHLTSVRTAMWVNETTKKVVQKSYQWDGDNLSKLSIARQTFYGGDSVSVPSLDEYTFSYKMGGGPIVHWQFFFPIVMDVDFSWAGYADLFYSLKTNTVPYYCKAVRYPDANNKSVSTKDSYSLTTNHNTTTYTIIVSCQEASGQYWQKECVLKYL